jgi:hypothetical protein
MTKHIDDDVRTVLLGIEWDGPIARITNGQLDRQLYIRVNKVLEALGGKWDRQRRGHLFDSDDATQALELAAETGEYSDRKQVLQEFFTPDWLADQMVADLDLKVGDSILEPSAGNGSLIRALYRRYPHAHTSFNIQLVEINPKWWWWDKGTEINIHIGDFLRWDPPNRYNRILMNPPFTRQREIDHVRHAYSLLAPGGRLVAIMSAGFKYRTNRKSVEFNWLVEAQGRVRELPENTFASEGTTVRTVKVILEKGQRMISAVLRCQY